jgi:hypothetical protein
MLALILSTILAACTSYRTQTIDYGGFYLEQDLHTSSNPLKMHNSTGLDEVRFCSRTINFCLKSGGINIQPNSIEEKKILLVRIEGISYFLDARAGMQLKCQNCKEQSFQAVGIVLDLVSSVAWTKKADKLFFNYGTEKLYKSVLLEYHTDGVIWKDIASSVGHVDDVSFNDAGTVLSWFECDPECTLVQYAIEKKEYSRQESPCSNIRNLEIIWKGNKAIPVHVIGADRPHRGGGGYGGVCRNDKGEPYFPILPY